MSGFGGFGQQQQSNAFGAATPAPSSIPTNNALSRSGDTVTSTGFASANSAFGGSSTFGTSNASFGFGGARNSATAVPPPFGSAAAPSTFGTSTTPSGGFASTVTPTNTGFFGSAHTGSASGSGVAFSGNSSSGFGGNVAGSATGFSGQLSFGGTSSTGSFIGGGSSVGANAEVIVGNPTQSSTSSAPLTFGTSSTLAFGSSSITNHQASAPTSFGFGSSPTKAFAASSSTTPSPGFGFGSSSSGAPAASSAFGFGSPSTGHAVQTGFGFGSSQSSVAVNESAPFGLSRSTQSQDTRTPFGGASNEQNQLPKYDDDMGEEDDNPAPATPFGARIPRKERTGAAKEGLTSQMLPDAPLTTSRSGESGEDQLALLRAKIQEKKNRLLKMKKHNQNNEADNNNDETKDGSESSPLTPPPSSFNSELAAKNALRFASTGNSQGQALSKLLPADLKERSSQLAQPDDHEAETGENDWGSSQDEGIEAIDDLQTRNLCSAKSLIGICKSMCPDEELIRREREGDIQLLEITDPGGIHPEGWTLRDTAVKRFRRSAADFKLDIPELVRPPEVLERVCGYLEEWVMERDRQGPDKRFAQQPSIIPPPLDVYQFIWDRTRMIRKDFILQNYIGTGGKCDARAVRCHERIARWHAMCEHQLSHIQEFVTHQSQQNVAELGQTMKTLNLYYDDALGRSITEDIGDNDKKYSQGCASDIVMGKSPVDFDDRVLSNTASSEDVTKRIIGTNGMKSSTHGTAEPEMRGLYILLTMNNEGGMEVIKYSGRLCTQRPEIFYSKPVQLALSIFQARKDHNYAKFFHLLRSPSTPYLFSCIMFKYVEQMRKTALMIMSRTYGAKHKTTGESFYDEYPLKRLVKLLCYEDEEEARAACTHYGITIESDLIRWRNSKFAEPRDPVKGTILTLKPRKMMNTIECKLNGATRLSVCRGGVSGEGATLSDANRGDLRPSKESSYQEQQLMTTMAAERAKKEAFERENHRKQRLLEEMQKQKSEDERLKTEAAKKEAERQRLEALAQEKMKAQQLEIERQRKALEEKRRLEVLRLEELRKKHEKEELLLKEAREREAAIQRAKEEKREIEKLQLLEKIRQEEKLKRRLAIEEEEKRRSEEEARRKAEEEEKRRVAFELEQQRKAEQERMRKQREDEEKRWRVKVESSKKILIWSLWLRQVRIRDRIKSSVRCLKRLDPTITCYPHLIYNRTPSLVCDHSFLQIPTDNEKVEHELYQLATASKQTINLSEIAADHFWKSLASSYINSSRIALLQPAILLKLSVVLPKKTAASESIISSLLTWLDSSLRLRHMTYSVSTNKSRSVSIRAVPVIGNDDINLCSNCDAALFVLPCLVNTDSRVEFPEEVMDSLPDDVPRMVILVGGTDVNAHYPRDIIDNVLGPEYESGCISETRSGVAIPSTRQLDTSLRRCCDALVRASLERARNQPIVRVSLSKLSFLCLQSMLLNVDLTGSISQFSQLNDAYLSIYEHSKSTLRSMITKIGKAFDEMKFNRSIWPSKEFFSERTKSVEQYFDGHGELPSDWYLSVLDTALFEAKVLGSFQNLFAPESFPFVVEGITQHLPTSYQQHHLVCMLDACDLSGCFFEVVSLIANGEISLDLEEMPTIYLPAATISKIIDTSSTFEDSIKPDVKELAEIPNFLRDEAPYSKKVEECNADNSPNKMVATPPVIHKRKPSDGTFTNSGTKRVRTAQSIRVTSDEERNSKEFTEHLEALLL